MDAALLDSDILSEVLKRKDPRVLAAARQYILQHQRLSLSAMTVYEITSGLTAKHATRQLSDFNRTLATSEIFDVSLPILLRAAELWALGHYRGHPHQDADLIIAATALETGRVLVTGNTSDYSWIAGLQLADWRVTPP